MSYTLTELTQAIQDTLETDEPSLVSHIPDFIRSAEERILKATRLSVFRKNSSLATVANNAYLALPADYLSPFSISLTVSGQKVFLDMKDSSLVQQIAGVGVPRFYAPYSVTSFILGPTPGAIYPVELNYLYRPASLADAGENGTTWLSVNARDTLFYGALIEAAIYQKSEAELMQVYDARFMRALERLKVFGESHEIMDNYRHGPVRVQRS